MDGGREVTDTVRQLADAAPPQTLEERRPRRRREDRAEGQDRAAEPQRVEARAEQAQGQLMALNPACAQS